MKVIVIGGYPGSGKSVIMKAVIAELKKTQKFKQSRQGLVKFMESDKTVILGVYDDNEETLFPGTDRLPMNVQPDAKRFIMDTSVAKPNKVIVFEGDRLFNGDMLLFLKSSQTVELVLCVVEVNRELLEARRAARSEQNETWRKGRETKVDRIAMIHPVHHHLFNNTKEEQENSVQELLDEIKGEWETKPVASKIKGLWS